MNDKDTTALDEQVIALIEQNGRATYREIAKRLGISERQAAFRLRRLIDNDVIRVITVVDAFSLGFRYILTIGIQVSDRPPAAVAEELAQIPNVIAAALMSGQYAIEVMVALENHAALSTFVQDRLGPIAGIRSLHPSLLLDVAKYETGSAPVNISFATLTIPPGPAVDDVDRAIIAKLWDNASETNENIAAELGISEATVRKRVGRLSEENLIHITAIRNIAIDKEGVFASIGLELDAGRQRAVVEALCALRQVHFVANVLGRFDVIAQVLVGDTVELSDFLNEVIARIPGIRGYHCAEAMKLVKYDYRWRVAGRPA